MKKRFKFPLYFVSFLLFVCLLFWGLATQTKLVENQVNRALRVFVQSKYSLKVNVGDIRGAFWRELVVTGITVDYVDQTSGYRVADIPYIKVNYRLANLWRKKWILDSLTIDHPRFAIRKTEEGKLPVALPQPERKVISKTGLFDFKIGNLKIEDGSLEYLSKGKQSAVDSLSLEVSLSKDAEGVKLNVYRGGLEYEEKDFVLTSLEGFAWLKKDTLYIEGLRIETEDSDVEISGNVGNLKEPEFFFTVKARPVDLGNIKKLAGVRMGGVLDLDATCEGNLKGFRGKATLNGLFFDRRFEPIRATYSYQNRKLTFSSVSGRAFGSPVSGKGTFDFSIAPEEYGFQGKVQNLDLNNIAFGSIVTDLSGEIHMQGRSTSEEELFMQIDVNLQEGKIEQYSFNQAEGVMDVTSDSVAFHPGFQFRYKNTGIALTGKLEYDGEIDLDAWVDFSDLTDFREQIFIEEMRGRGRAFVHFGGKTEDFNLKGEFTSDSCYAYELFSSDARIELDIINFLSSQRGQVDVLFLNGEAWGVGYDSLVSRLEVDDTWIKIDTARLESQYLALNFWGELDVSGVPQTLLIYEILLDYRGNVLKSTSPTVVNIDTQDVRITKCIISGETGKIDISGTIDYQENMDISLEVSGLDVAPWAALLTSEPIEGKLSAQTALRGNFDRPQIGLNGEVEQLKFRDMDLGELRTDISYRDRKIEIRDLAVTDPDWRYTLKGFLPLDLSFTSVEERILEEPQRLNVSANGKRLELIKLFIPEIEYLTGDFTGDLEISGSLLHPRFDGQMTVKEGTLKLVELADPVEDLLVEMSMEDENLILDNLSGLVESGRGHEGGAFTKVWRALSPGEKIKGEITGYGTIDLKDIQSIEYSLYFSGDRIPVDYEYADLTAIADVIAQISGSSPPLISAEIYLSELFYREPFAGSGSGTFVTPTHQEADLWDWNLDVSVANNCWIHNDDVNLEFSGDVRVLRESGDLRILGDMETIRGKYFLYGTKFKIEKGLFFFDNIERIDPRIDFLVSTRMRGESPESSVGSPLMGTGTDNEMKLTITGTFSEPEVEPPSGSPYSREDVLYLLALQRDLDEVEAMRAESFFQERVIESLGGAYSSRFLESIAGPTLGVETFEIVPPLWGKEFHLRDTQITIGKYISDKVYLRYSRRLSQSIGQEAGVEYRLNKNLFLEGRKDKDGLYRLGLNLNWEY
ncbi:MAG: translocation/assembly module TamB domain-containing protein [Candidatus Zixiibacteriota bacterium]|nr:MAG: translocation/assembly module TamB domain-containing protein [candidate division Zixibacteria bacterium]